jgi:BirA family biotin operon repressor/biotin-[acetyl-CoA-carboxylase] ligase
MNCREEWHLDTQHIGRRVRVFDCVDSTNSLAASLAHDPAQDGLVILADEQTAGRGQHGRTWLCAPGTGVLLSVLLFPPPALRRPALLTAWAAVSVCETIHKSTGLPANIKWPNDVLIHGRKICGILIEQARGTVAGIGLNVNQSAADFEEAGLPEAGSLTERAGPNSATNHRLDRDHVARCLIGQLDEEYQRICQGDLATLEACWKRRIGLLGKPVIAECLDGTFRGRLREITWEGLELELPDGKRLCKQPELVRQLQADTAVEGVP